MDHCGILYHTHDRATGTYTAAQIPLEEVKVKVWIADVTARVTLIQRFYNATPNRTGRAKYCFPVPASAAICAFQFKSSDGRILRGECKEKDLAQEQYEAAVASGQTAGLLEYVTDDIFTISVGHIPPYLVVETHLAYVMTLYTGDYMDQVRFQLPYYVGQRYGIPPEGLDSAVQPALGKTRISVTADIQMSGRIEETLSPSHPLEIHPTPYETHLGRPSRRRTTVRYQSDSYLDRDFILLIRAKDLDKPRCFVEIRKDARHRYPDSLALQLTLVPRTKLPPIRSQRYLFLVDRSGSMSQDYRIETAKNTLILLLRMIPEGSTFNIFSFGDNCVPWRSKSELYTKYTVQEATSHVEGFDAELGGTEIRGALAAVFATSPPDVPTVLFVLTDGESYDIEATKQLVAHFVQTSNVPRRVFTLGIGNGVSTAMCDGIARAGNGEFLLATDTESILPKCAKLFTAARTPFVRGVTLDWGVSHSSSQVGSPEVTFSNQPSPRTVATRPLPPIQQAPHQIEAIHSGTRMNVFAIVTSRHAKPPKHVVLSGILDDETQKPFQFKVAVQQIALVQSEDDIPLIHTMAAWKLIQEYTDNPRIPLPRPVSGGIATDDELRQSVIIQLGVQYQIASQHTSFVAVEEPRDTRQGRKMKQGFLYRHPEHVGDDLDAESEESVQGPVQVVQRQVHAVLKAMTSALSALSSLWANVHEQSAANFIDPEASDESVESLPGSFPRGLNRHPSQTSLTGTDDGPTEFGSQDSERSSVRTFSTLSSLSGWSSGSSSDWSIYSDSSSDSQRPPSPTFHRRPVDGNRTPRQRDSKNIEQVPPSVVELVKLQEFDGSFGRGNLARRIVGEAAFLEGNNLSGLERDVWMTVCCVAFLKKHLVDNPELLDNLLVKPLEYLRSKAGIDIDNLLDRAGRVVQ